MNYLLSCSEKGKNLCNLWLIFSMQANERYPAYFVEKLLPNCMNFHTNFHFSALRICYRRFTPSRHFFLQMQYNAETLVKNSF